MKTQTRLEPHPGKRRYVVTLTDAGGKPAAHTNVSVVAVVSFGGHSGTHSNTRPTDAKGEIALELGGIPEGATVELVSAEVVPG